MHKIEFKKAAGYIALSVLLISGSSYLFLFYLQHLKQKYGEDERYHILSIVQSCTSRDEIPNSYLAEVVDLSSDFPTNLYRFNCREAERKLLRAQVFSKAKVSRIKPSTLFIEYALRDPIAFLGDYSNTAIDKGGHLFPFKPFYPSKQLPEIYLGEIGLADAGIAPHSEEVWECQLTGRYLELTLGVIGYFKKREAVENVFLKQIDLSQAFLESCGKRQLIVAVEEEGVVNKSLVLYPRLLRLNPYDYSAAINRYFRLQPYLPRDKPDVPVVIDLRIPKLALFSSN